MAKCYSSFMKVCATCAYWTGNRQTDYFGTTVTTDSLSVKGKCMCQQLGGWRGQERQAGMNCTAFKKWDVLG